jgi:uncharacterized protein YndB with AHSA1/START domain
MGVSVCPAATLAAPVERVWALLAEPAQWQRWMDGQVERVEPPGVAQPGQVVVVTTSAFGRRWRVPFTIQDVDAARHRLCFLVRFPLGVVEHGQIACSPVDPSTCRVQHG